MLRKSLRQLGILKRETSKLIFRVGLLFVVIFSFISYSYLRGEVVSNGEGGIVVDITSVVSGYVAYIWLGLLVVWLVAEAVPHILRLRNWWVHSETHRITIQLKRDNKGLVGWLVGRAKGEQ